MEIKWKIYLWHFLHNFMELPRLICLFMELNGDDIFFYLQDIRLFMCAQLLRTFLGIEVKHIQHSLGALGSFFSRGSHEIDWIFFPVVVVVGANVVKFLFLKGLRGFFSCVSFFSILLKISTNSVGVWWYIWEKILDMKYSCLMYAWDFFLCDYAICCEDFFSWRAISVLYQVWISNYTTKKLSE